MFLIILEIPLEPENLFGNIDVRVFADLVNFERNMAKSSTFLLHFDTISFLVIKGREEHSHMLLVSDQLEQEIAIILHTSNFDAFLKILVSL